MKKMIAACLAVLLAPASASALELDLRGETERSVVAYTCSDGVDRTAEYVNLPHDSLALVDGIDGVRRIFVNVVAASGARYETGALIWWSKGAEATLEDVMAAEGVTPVTCRETPAG